MRFADKNRVLHQIGPDRDIRAQPEARGVHEQIAELLDLVRQFPFSRAVDDCVEAVGQNQSPNST